MTKEDLKEIHKIDTELLLNVVSICKKHNIEYFLMYGTLLGAVRHKGPIPWDDDIDIGMTRDNYLKFLEVAYDELDEQNEIKIMGSGSVDYVSEIKIGRKNTIYCMPGCENLDIQNHVQLDIFLVDYAKKNGKFMNMICKYLHMISLNWDEKKLMLINLKKSKVKLKFLVKLAIYCSHMIRFILKEKNIEKIIYNIFTDKKRKSGLMGAIVDFDYGINIWDKKYIEKLTMLQYDGYEFACPAEYDALLKLWYGDYMQVPPENKRYRKHFDELIFKKI